MLEAAEGQDGTGRVREGAGLRRGTMTKHTPGPWVIRYDGHGGISVLTENYQIGYVSSEPRQEADAHLIAAAPELLAAAKEFLRIADRRTVEADNLRAAIAKAEGRE